VKPFKPMEKPKKVVGVYERPAASKWPRVAAVVLAVIVVLAVAAYLLAR
jgi:hypothetical protein